MSNDSITSNPWLNILEFFAFNDVHNAITCTVQQDRFPELTNVKDLTSSCCRRVEKALAAKKLLST